MKRHTTQEIQVYTCEAPEGEKEVHDAIVKCMSGNSDEMAYGQIANAIMDIVEEHGWERRKPQTTSRLTDLPKI